MSFLIFMNIKRASMTFGFFVFEKVLKQRHMHLTHI